MDIILSFIAGIAIASLVAYFVGRKFFALFESKFEATSERLLKQRTEELHKTNTDNVSQLLHPLQQEMENVRKLMGETRSANEKSTASLEGALKQMIQQTSQISQDATNLADALKNRGKVHGDWGEQVLEDILAGSGLRPGIEYSCQESFKGEHGNELRPDVVIRCADGKCIIVDSKVSLTAYTDALGAATDDERDAAVRRNFDSVKKHIRELSDKQYPKYVEGSMNYVLMFVPNEGAYVMAMNHDRALAQDAFRQGIIIVNPTNLMLTLYLVLQTWQQTRQEDNCRKIIEAANGMYDKIVGLVDTCNTLGNQLETANNTYNKAMTQLSEGSGNVLRRVEGLKELGVTSTKRATKRRSLPDDPLTLVCLILAFFVGSIQLHAATTPADSTLRGFGNGYRNYALELNAGYAYNNAWSHHGAFSVRGLLPINPYFEASIGVQALTANVYTVAANLRPKFDVKVGQVFIDMNLCNRFVARADQYDFAAALALGWRMDYVSIAVGGFLRYNKFMHQDLNEGGRASFEPVSLLYSLEVYCRPRTSDWNIWLLIANRNDFEIERFTQPLFGLGAWYDINEHWRTSITASFKPTGMFHMNAVFYGAGVQAGCRYTF